jgi:hypothetical protein
MRTRMLMAAAILAVAILAASCTLRSVQGNGSRTVRVAQSGSADVVGSDSAALQKAADTLRPGDTLEIGPGTYTMDNSLVVHSGVTVRGSGRDTILMKSAGVESPLVEDGDYGESQLAVADLSKFHPGMGIALTDDQLKQGWDISISTVTAIDGRFLRISPMTIRDYDAEKQHAVVRNSYPILCARDAENVAFENLVVDGNKAQNAYIDGCLGGAIYMYRVRNVAVRNCVARNYNGDGISFQISDGVQVTDSESYGHAGYGVHPGTGSARSVVRNCRMHNNGDVGLFLCWRVRQGKFTDNVIENNGRYGISIGHKDTDNEFVNNTIARNGVTGVLFREETMNNSGHRNIFRANKIVDNGSAKEGYGFLIQPRAGDLVIENNQIADTRPERSRTQKYGVYKLPGAGSIRLAGNTMSGHSAGDYQEAATQVSKLQ